MSRQPMSTPTTDRRIASGLPFVERLARRLASSMPQAVEIADLVQDGMLGLIDAAHRFNEARGIRFETFAEPRVRGAMIDALRRAAWPRGVRRQRREIEAAREALRHEHGQEPSLLDLATRVGVDEARLRRIIVRIRTIEATASHPTGERIDVGTLPTALSPVPPDSPPAAYEKQEARQRIRTAMASLPAREKRVIGLYYFGDVTMKRIGVAIGVNESRVSQLHARAIGHLRAVLDGLPSPLVDRMVVRVARPDADPRRPRSTGDRRRTADRAVRGGHAAGAAGRQTPAIR